MTSQTLSRLLSASCVAVMMTLSPALAQDTKVATPVAIGISGWTGFAPLTLAAQAGLGRQRLAAPARRQRSSFFVRHSSPINLASARYSSHAFHCLTASSSPVRTIL